MVTDLDDAWADYAREQDAVRRREAHGKLDVSGRDSLDVMITAIAGGRRATAAEAVRAATSSARRERARAALVDRHAAGNEGDLRSRMVPDPETVAVIASCLGVIPAAARTVVILDAVGYDDDEVGRRLGTTPATARQRLSRATRGISAYDDRTIRAAAQDRLSA